MRYLVLAAVAALSLAAESRAGFLFNRGGGNCNQCNQCNQGCATCGQPQAWGGNYFQTSYGTPMPSQAQPASSLPTGSGYYMMINGQLFFFPPQQIPATTSGPTTTGTIGANTAAGGQTGQAFGQTWSGPPAGATWGGCSSCAVVQGCGNCGQGCSSCGVSQGCSQGCGVSQGCGNGGGCSSCSSGCHGVGRWHLFHRHGGGRCGGRCR